MRMRKKKHGSERIEACKEYLIQSREDLTQLPIYLEIGCGKGTFICETAQRNPDISFVAMERVGDVLMLAAEKVKSLELPNVKLMNENADILPERFAKGDVKRIYLNFSDPWPKAKHHKRRLTHENFLELYKKILTDDGEIFFKTDNRDLFDFSLEEFKKCGFELRNLTYDLHNSEWNEGNVVTEYEANFSAKGFSINRVEAYLIPEAKTEDEHKDAENNSNEVNNDDK